MNEEMLLSFDGPLATIRLNRPDQLNSINANCLDLLEAYVNQIESNPAVRVAVVRGEGRAFCAGADLKSIPQDENDPGATERFLRKWYRAFNRLASCSKPTIAVVHGLTLAGGLELVMGCDLAVAAKEARIGDQHANFGLIPGGGGTQRLPRIIGEKRAKWLLYSGDWIDGEQAEQWGLVNRAVVQEELESVLSDMAESLASKSPLGLAATKFLVDRGLSVDLDTGLDMEVRMAARHLISQDVKIGLEAFLTKTKPNFIGR